MQAFMALPVAARVAIIVVGLLQLSLQIWSLMDLVRRPATGGNLKLVWTLVTLFGGLVGALVYIGVGRKALEDAAAREGATARDPLGDDRSGDRARTIDRLYGDRDA